MADVGSTPQLEAPTLAELYAKITARAPWLAGDTLHIDHDTFEKARIEMKAVQARQGRAVPSAPWIKEPNFLLRGIAVVTSA